MVLSFQTERSHQFPRGYWYAATDDGNYDAAGESVETALGELVVTLEAALAEGGK